MYCHRPLDKLLCVDAVSRIVCDMIGGGLHVCCSGLVITYCTIGFRQEDGSVVFPGADEFFPPFLLLLIRTNPPHLVSTIEYCSQLLDTTWSDHPTLEILLSHLEACKV